MTKIGEIISIPQGAIRHFGVIFAPGKVVHASKKEARVVISTLQEFSEGKFIRSHGRWGQLNEGEIQRRAYAFQGQPYDLFHGNCEHVIRRIVGTQPTSPQLWFWSIVGIGALWLLCRRSRVA